MPMEPKVPPLEEKLNLPAESPPSAYFLHSQKERNSPISYVLPHSYLEQFQKERRDVLKFTPWANVQKFPRQGNEGLYGWTYRNKDGTIRLREDLHSERKMEVDLHECGHTPDEYETRLRTAAKMEAMFPFHEKYSTRPREYFF